MQKVSGKWAERTNFRNNKTLLSNVELDIRYGASERENGYFYPKIRTLAFLFSYMVVIGELLISRVGQPIFRCFGEFVCSAIPSYRLCPEVSITQITEDIARCITFYLKK